MGFTSLEGISLEKLTKESSAYAQAFSSATAMRSVPLVAPTSCPTSLSEIAWAAQIDYQSTSF